MFASFLMLEEIILTRQVVNFLIIFEYHSLAIMRLCELNEESAMIFVAGRTLSAG
ncbi:hypothetical protein SAMN05518872_102283 [Psychrobacillus sp. OK032]|nr:hypothetical protein SAMN05518872_102283 [Psychrobacillus sp. OK032]